VEKLKPSRLYIQGVIDENSPLFESIKELRSFLDDTSAPNLDVNPYPQPV
jgi:hypothetical protein